MTPKPAAMIPPQMLEPMTKPEWKYVDAEHLADSGIYSQEDISRLRDHIMFPVETPALLSTFARTATGHRVPLSGISLTGFLDRQSLPMEPPPRRAISRINLKSTLPWSVLLPECPRRPNLSTPCTRLWPSTQTTSRELHLPLQSLSAAAISNAHDAPTAESSMIEPGASDRA